MKYITSVLREDEQVAAEAHIHWVVYLPQLVITFVGVFLYFSADLEAGLVEAYARMAVGAAIGAWASWHLLSGLIYFLFTEIAVTDRRLISKFGLISRNTTSIPAHKIESTHVEQSVMGRVLGYGTVSVRGTGDHTEELKFVIDPVEFRNALNDLVDDEGAGKSGKRKSGDSEDE